MPYYCTVPRCTSMAGKAENVSFHQFPRDEELAKLWNKILKRGKPYTKYSKVCSLHFKPEDYTITSVGKNKGQWRTLRKDAIPSQNLPSETPTSTNHRTRQSWVPNDMHPTTMNTRMHHQVAQAIYMQTMLAMQAATNGSNPTPPQLQNTDLPHTSSITLSDIEQLLQKRKTTEKRNGIEDNQDIDTQETRDKKELTSYKCQECFKCFKDPDVFILHKRSHIRSVPESLQGNLNNEKENLNSNSEYSRQDTLRANPILANLLKSSIAPANEFPETGVFDVNNVLSIENQIMTAMSSNMEVYIRNLTSMLSQQVSQGSENGQHSGHSEQNSESGQHSGHSEHNSEDSHNFVEDDDSMDAENHVQSANNFAQEYDNFLGNVQNTQGVQNLVPKDQNSTSNIQNFLANDQNSAQNVQNLETDDENSTQDTQNFVDTERNSAQDTQNFVANDQNPNQTVQKADQKSTKVDKALNCDNQDLNDSKDSNNLVIDETV